MIAFLNHQILIRHINERIPSKENDLNDPMIPTLGR